MSVLSTSFYRRSAAAPARRRGSLSHLLPPCLLTLLLLILITLITFHTIERFTDVNRWVAHTHDVLAELDAACSHVQDAEIQQRDYLRNGGPQRRTACEQSAAAVGDNLSTLRRLTRDNPVQQENLTRIDSAAAAWRQRLQASLQSPRPDGLAAPQPGETDLTQEPVRLTLDRMTLEETRLRRLRLMRAERAGETARTLVLGGIVLVVGLLLLAGVMGGQYHRERMRAENALLASQEELEQRVAERTKALEEVGETLREREQRLRFLADSMPQIVWTSRPDGVSDYYNQRWHDYTGLSRAQTDNGGVQAAVHVEDLEKISAGWQEAMKAGRPYTMEYRLKRADGEYHWHLGRVLPLRDDQGTIILWVGTGTDIDDYKQVQARLQESHDEMEERVRERTAELVAARDKVLESEGQFRSVVEAMQEGLLVQDRERTVLLCNRTAEDILGALPGTLTGGSALAAERQIIREDGTEFEPEAHPSRIALRTGRRQAAIVMGVRRPSESVTWLSVNTAPLFHIGEKSPYAAVTTFSDITAQRAAARNLEDYNVVLEFQKRELEKTNGELARVNEQLEALATLDGLTGLKNHRAFQERLTEEFGRSRRYALPLSLVMVDVDRFKEYNDSYGHPAGDVVLREVARILAESVRECDFTARYGGEEFVLILPQTDGEGAFVIAERCRAAIEAANWPNRQITASFGLASLPAVVSSVTESAALLAEADELLYVAKAGGRNQVARSYATRTRRSSRDRRTLNLTC